MSSTRTHRPPGATSRTPPPSAAVYTPLMLRCVYEILVLQFSNTYAWRCSTKRIQLPFFQKHLSDAGPNHLDVGVGTGYYLAKSASILRSNSKKVVLMDITPHTLDLATQRLNKAGVEVETVFHDATQPWDRPETLPRFDSIGFFYVFHCMAATDMKDKVHAVASVLKPHLEPENGVFYGSTILGDEANHNVIGRRLMDRYNAKGIFGNRGDKESDLREALEEHFGEVEVVRKGRVALWTARKPTFS